MSEILDDDTREAFLQSLSDLREQQDGTKTGQEELRDDYHRDIEHQLQELEPRHEEEPSEPPDKQDHTDDSEATLKAEPWSAHRRTHSEHDYGIENPRPKSPLPQTNSKPPVSSRPSQSKAARSPPTTSRKKPPPSPPGFYKRTTTILLNLQHLIANMTLSLSKNPMALLRFVLFVLGLVMALSRRDVKDRIARGWDKVRQTVGMGVKVSYI